MASVSEGSLQTDVEVTNAQFAHVVAGIAELYRALSLGVNGVQAVLHGLELGERTAEPSSSSRGRDHSRDVDRLRRELPSPVQRGSGQKTHGRWFTPNNTDAVVLISSGEDLLFEQAVERIRELGARHTPVTAVDVEIKLAAHMARNGITDATVVINNVPCKGPFGCDTLVPMLLPEGSSLTVHGVTDQGVKVRKTYTGGAKSPWR